MVKQFARGGALVGVNGETLRNEVTAILTESSGGSRWRLNTERETGRHAHTQTHTERE